MSGLGASINHIIIRGPIIRLIKISSNTPFCLGHTFLSRTRVFCKVQEGGNVHILENEKDLRIGNIYYFENKKALRRKCPFLKMRRI